MEKPAATVAITAILAEIRIRLEMASAVAKGAQVCADSGSIDQAVQMALEIEQAMYESSRLLDAASLINRLSRG
jgi:hypothetical protein